MSRSRTPSPAALAALVALAAPLALPLGCSAPDPAPLVATGGLESDAPLPWPGFAPQGGGPVKVVVIQAADFDCGFCARTTPHVERLRVQYPTELRFEFVPFPLGGQGRGRELAALALGAHLLGAFWPAHDALYELAGGAPPDHVLARAAELGLDADAWQQAARSERVQRAVDEGIRRGEALGVIGTPTFFVNGVRMQGSLPHWVLDAVVEDQRRKFDARVRAGASPEHALRALVAEQARDPDAFWGETPPR